MKVPEEFADWSSVHRVHAQRRQEWVETHAPHLGQGTPLHRVHVSTPQGHFFELEELDAEGTICCAYVPRDQDSNFGTTEEVVAQATGLPLDDPWVVEVGSALARERGWKRWGSGWGRRGMLEVRLGQGQMFHVTASSNRQSIVRYGLDWRRMGPATGVAGSSSPELPGIFLQESADDEFFVRMASFPTDIWGVVVDGRWVESGPSGWWIVAEPVAPARLELQSAEHRVEGG